MNDQQRLTDIKYILELLYTKLSIFERELIVSGSISVKFELQQKIKTEILPNIRTYEKEYWDLYPLNTIVISERDAEANLFQVEQALKSLDHISSTKYPSGLVPLLEEMQAQLNDLHKPFSAKLKIALPLIPAIAAYELEMETEGLMYRAWKSIKELVRR